MSYCIGLEEPVDEAVRRIAREQIEQALGEIEDPDLDLHSTVHQVRKRCKRIRGLLRLVRPAFDQYSAENADFRDAARKLSELRDATSMIECVDALVDRFANRRESAVLGTIRERLVKRRSDYESQIESSELLDEVRLALEAAFARAGGWQLDRDGFAALGEGFSKVVGRARRAMQRARQDPATEALHEWRKRVKYHRYHLRLLGELWPDALEPWYGEAKLLSDRLGDDHDLAVLRGVLVENAGGLAVHLEALLGLVDARRGELQAWSWPSGWRLYAEKPKHYRGRLERYWEACRIDRELAASLPEGSATVS